MNATNRYRLSLLISVLLLALPLLVPSLSFSQSPPSRMTVAELGRLLDIFGEKLNGKDGKWEFHYKSVPMVTLADEKFDRMRIIAFIEEGADLSKEKLLVLLQANFDRTLDARYALFRGFLVSTFVHPLSPLSPKELEAALQQVSNLVRNYGGTYSGGAVRFGIGGQ